MNQRKYDLELVAEVGLGNAKLSLIPLECNIKFTNVDFDKDIKTTYIVFGMFLDTKVLYISCFILQHIAGHRFFSTDLKSVYEKNNNVTLDYCY